jgi:eukaryotic-like serine/threonine-protein kinase
MSFEIKSSASAELRRCSDCGTLIPRRAPGGLCPSCLLEEMLISTNGHYFGDYQLLGEIAHGGMGVVYKACRIEGGRIVALKMIRAGRFASEEEVERFRRETEAVARLDHPNIVPIYDVGEEEGRVYFTMKLVEGESLTSKSAQDRLSGHRNAAMESGRAGPGQIKAVARLVSSVARAIHYAHQRGVLHRDLKPANILLDSKGEPHITDFGLAHIDNQAHATETGSVLGSPEYIAPEQVAGRPSEITTAADI